MKNFLFSLLRFISFFILWGAFLSLFILVVPLFKNLAVERLVNEIGPFVVLLIVTLLFSKIIDKGNNPVSITFRFLPNLLIGFLVGVFWFGIAFAIQYFGGWASIEYQGWVKDFLIYAVALFINTMMQEYLVRGYLFSMLANRQNQLVATILTTLLFTSLHGGAFEAGVVAVLNVVTMSLFVTILMIYTNSILAPIVTHFIWNFSGGMIFNCVSIPYPNVFNVTPIGNRIFSGGEYKLENSIITLIANMFCASLFLYLHYRKKKNRTTLSFQ